MSEYLGWYDILKGVGELVVDEATLALHALTDHLRHPGISDHGTKPEYHD